jgi:hypothetical protein
LGNTQITATHCHIVADPAHPEIWDSNHADNVTAQTEAEISSVFAAMDQHLGHTPWRVIHTDCFTPEAFVARLALDDFEQRPVTIQMALQGDHAEGRRTGGLELSPEFSAAKVAGYRAKSGAYHFHLAIQDGVAVAYGALAAAPNGAGMIEDLFTLQSARRRGMPPP